MPGPLPSIAPGPRTARGGWARSGLGRSSGNGSRTRGARGPGVARAARRDPAVLHGVLWALAAGLAAFTIRRPISPHDEGLMLQAGARILAGQWPYRDFWSNYPPGQATLLAGLDAIFGVSMLTWRIAWVLFAASASGVGYGLVRRAGAGRPLALLAWLAVAGAMAWPSTPEPDPAALLIALAALLAVPRRPLLAGALAGLAVFFRLEIGIAALLGVLVLARDAEDRVWASTLAVLVAALTLGPFAIAAPTAMVHDVLGFYAIAHDQRLPLPLAYHGPLKPDKLLEFYDPVLLLAIAATGTLVLARALLLRRAAPLALALVPLGIVGVGYLLARTDEFHLLPLSAILAVGLAAQAGTAGPGGARRPGGHREPTGRRARVRPEVAARGALVLGVALIALAGLDRRGGQLLHPPAAAAMPGPAGDGVQTSPADARSLRALIPVVHRLVPPGRPIFVADPRFDVVRVGDPLLYITLDRPDPTHYDVLQPGLVTTARVQRQIAATLRGRRVRVIVRWLNPTAEPDPLPAHPSGAHVLDRYIAAHYRPRVRFGDYEVLVRAGSG